MDVKEAVEFVQKAIPRQVGVWADFGAGSGTFTRALLALLPEGSSIIAVDRDTRAIATLHAMKSKEPNAARVVAVQGDVERLDLIGEVANAVLDGALFANVL